jgi:ferritin-like metal-binding protein YciE
MKFQSLYNLYMAELHDLYDAERQITRALPKMIEAVSSDELRKALQEHLNQTQSHINRLESVFEMHAEHPKGEKCEGMEGIISEGRALLKQDADTVVRDAAIISAVQMVEHYEIAVYGCVRTYADQMGMDRAALVLAETLAEEEAMDKKLTAIAQTKINIEAARRAR